MQPGMHPAIARKLGLPPNPSGAPVGNSVPPPMANPAAPGMFQPALGPNPLPAPPPQPNSMGSYAPEPGEQGIPTYGQALNPQAMGRPVMAPLKRLPLLPRPGTVPGA